MLETGTLASWLCEALVAKGRPVVRVGARRANAAMKLNPNNTDDNDEQTQAIAA